MTTLVQQLYMNRRFRYLLTRIDDHKEPDWIVDAKGERVDDNFLHQVQRIFGYLDKTTRFDFGLSAFCANSHLFGENMNICVSKDVQEFLMMFLNQLETEIKDHPLRRLVDNFYQGSSVNTFRCHSCNQIKRVEEKFSSVTLAVKISKNLTESFNWYVLEE